MNTGSDLLSWLSASTVRARGWICLVFAGLQAVSLEAAAPWTAPERGFVSSRAATNWESALISGNGKFGALVYGQPNDETIVLNHARLFLPLNEPLPPVETGSHLLDLRRMMAEGQYQRAADYVVELSKDQGYGGKRWTDPFVPAFDLKIAMAPIGTVEDYGRSVNFSTGTVSVKWKDSRGEFQRRLFVSRPDDLVVINITGPGRGTVDCDLRLAQRPSRGQGGWDAEQMYRKGVRESSAVAEVGWLTFLSRFQRTWPGSLQGCAGLARVVAKGGTARAEGDKMVVRGADEVLVLLRIELLGEPSDAPVARMKKRLTKVKPDFEALLARHVEMHGRLFNRCRLDLGGAADRTLTSEELIAKSRVGNLSSALLEKEFDAALRGDLQQRRPVPEPAGDLRTAPGVRPGRGISPSMETWKPPSPRTFRRTWRNASTRSFVTWRRMCRNFARTPPGFTGAVGFVFPRGRAATG